MHQVYDDEMTFKLVAAASTVSGLPVDVCLEEFGKHFLVYCQKNGYDQILRVLGSNLYDFLTNLDNLHDHLASIYPGMRAPSFRVTRHLNRNSSRRVTSGANDQQNQNQDRELKQNEPANERPGGDELHKENVSCCSSLTSSMYLHYYSDRAGLSPIVKGLVMAVAREFFQTDIVVTECQMLPSSVGKQTSSSESSGNGSEDNGVRIKTDQQRRPSLNKRADEPEKDGVEDSSHHQDDHVVLKIDRRKPLLSTTTVPPEVRGLTSSEPRLQEEESAQDVTNKLSSGPDLTAALSGDEDEHEHSRSVMLNIYDSLSTNPRESLVNGDIMMQTFPFHVIFDREFNLVQVGKSLLRVTSSFWQRNQPTASRRQHHPASSGEIDQGPSYSQQSSDSFGQPITGSGSKGEPEVGSREETEDRTAKGREANQLVKFGDLFRIMRPKIEFTFDAIADHTNQVFVVKTRPLVLNADYSRQMKRLSSGSSSSGSLKAGGDSRQRPPAKQDPARHHHHHHRHHQRPSLCPFDRIAAERRRQSAGGQPSKASPSKTGKESERTDDDKGERKSAPLEHQSEADADAAADDDDDDESVGVPLEASESLSPPPPPSLPSPSPPSPSPCPSLPEPEPEPELEPKPKPEPTGDQTPGCGTGTGNESVLVSSREQSSLLDELGDPVNHLSLRLKGQMIVLLGGQLCLYLCSPRVDHLDQLMECGVKMSDFALHDRARELMLMSHAHKEDREAVKKLDQASNDLKKMDTKLRQENKRTNEVLHNIFPAKIASLLSHGHQVESESFELVTCLYSDIIGFTKMCGSENVKPIDIVRLLNTLYLQFDNLTNIHGVFKVETIGDAYVVVGGLPEPLHDHADRCVKMGLDMVKVIATVRSPADQQPIQMRIGIHSGPVMAGIVGIRVPRYSLFGNTTTLANQLETHGVGGKIHISDFTLKNLVNRDRFVIEDNPNQISGIPFVTYFVTNYLGDRTETLKHERILEEQLIKDFELMGDQLELVDDYQQLYSASESAGGRKIFQQRHDHPHQLEELEPDSIRDETDSRLHRLAGELKDDAEGSGDAQSGSESRSSNKLADTSATFGRAQTGPGPGDGVGVGVGTDPGEPPLMAPNRSPTAKVAAKVISERALASNSGNRPLALEALRVNSEPTDQQEVSSQQLLSADSQAADNQLPLLSGERDKQDKLLLMDLEEPWAFLLSRLSGQLSSAIISGAMKQVSEMVDMAEILRLQESSSVDIVAAATATTGQYDTSRSRSGDKSNPAFSQEDVCCPLCEGCGRISSGFQKQRQQATSEASTTAALLLSSLADQRQQQQQQTRPDILASLLAAALRQVGAKSASSESGHAKRDEDSAKKEQTDERLCCEGAFISSSQIERLLGEQCNKLQRQLDRISQQQAGLQFQLESATGARATAPATAAPEVVTADAGPHPAGLRRSSSEGMAAIQEICTRRRTGDTKKSSLSYRGPKGACVVASLAAGGPLSSNIQRMKRMDTLKRRRLKKGQQQLELRSDLNGSLSRVSNPLVTSPDQMSSPGWSCQLEESRDGQYPRLEETGESSDQLIEEEEEEEEEEEKEDQEDNNNEEHEQSSPQTTTDRIYLSSNRGKGSKVNTGNRIDPMLQDGASDIDTVSFHDQIEITEKSSQDQERQVGLPEKDPHRTNEGGHFRQAESSPIDTSVGQQVGGKLPLDQDGPKRTSGQSFLSAIVSALSPSSSLSCNKTNHNLSRQRPGQEKATASKWKPHNSKPTSKRSCSCLRGSDSSQSFNYTK